MRGAPTIAHAFFLAGALVAPAFAQADDTADVVAARAAVRTAMPDCEFDTNPDGTPDGENLVYEIRYRTQWQDQDSPDEALTLVQLHCFSAAYNFSSIFVTRGAEGKWDLLSFAEPSIDFDYADEAFTKLKAPPKVVGYIAKHELLNSSYDPDTKTINSEAKWRGAGDAWSAGTWVFSEGVFQLRKYEVDPTFSPSGDAEADTEAPESYVVFEAPAGAP
jgi:hypothetical protein